MQRTLIKHKPFGERYKIKEKPKTNQTRLKKSYLLRNKNDDGLEYATTTQVQNKKKYNIFRRNLGSHN